MCVPSPSPLPFLQEKSDDNLKLTTDADLAGALAVGGMGGGASFQGGGGLPGLPMGGGGATQVSSLASGEDDNDGGGADAEAEADDALAAKGEDLGVEGEGEAGGEEDGQEDGPGGAGRGHGGPTASGTMVRASGLPPGGRVGVTVIIAITIRGGGWCGIAGGGVRARLPACDAKPGEGRYWTSRLISARCCCGSTGKRGGGWAASETVGTRHHGG